MIISHKYKFIWFQPRKTASTTIYKRLGLYNESPYKQQKYFNRNLRKISDKHILLKEFLILPEARLDYKKIIFVRNPYDRFYSDYLQCKKDYIMNHGNDFSAKPWGLILKKGFPYFCEYSYKTFKKSEYLISLISNYDNVVYNDENIIDYIGFVERFETDFNKICSLLNITKYSKKSENVEIPQIYCNPLEMNIKDYKYLNQYSNEQIRLVNEIFEKDFGFFKYLKVDA